MASSNLISYAGWTFLPNLVTGGIQTVYYGITIRAGEPKPQPGSPRYIKHRRRIHILVIVLYLLYTVFEADWQIRRAGDFYRDLGLNPNVDDRGIKSRFRRLAALHHPDKATAESATSESLFVHLKAAQDTLLDPTKRFAYDRFGPESTEWRHCASVHDYLVIGLQALAPYYAAGGLVMVILGILGYLDWGRYWRYVFFVSLFVFEVHTVTRPYFPPITIKLVDPLLSLFTAHTPYLPFQQLILARKLVLTLFIALSQLGPLLAEAQQQPAPQKQAQANPEQAQRAQIERVEQLARSTEFEATRLLGLDLAPFAGDEPTLAEVRGRLKEWLVQNTIRADPEVRDAVGQVMSRRRVGAPHGARGTR